MKLTAMLTLLTLLAPLTLWSKNPDKIIGGSKSAGHDFFLQLSMDGTLNRAFCGSTAIAPGVAVTAAHCVASRTTSFKLVHGIDQDGVKKLTVIDVHAVIAHHQYGGTFNDIALIFFDQNQAKDVVVPAAINRGQVQLDNSSLLAIGRGNMTSIGTLYGKDLFEVNLPHIDLETCKSVPDYAGAINNTHVCAGILETGGQDSCQGDSGGPLVVIRNGLATLVGVTNFGLGCAQKGLPGVYASPKAHASWIDSNIARYNNNEVSASPNMDLAFASKCHLTKIDEETLQQQNANDIGMLSLASLYTAKTRFSPSAAVTLSANSKEVCRFKLGSDQFVAKFDQNKIVVQNLSKNTWWQAAAKRETDSLYQRCMVTGQDSFSFDIAVGDGAAMISLEGSVAALAPIQATQISADFKSIATCTIGRYVTTLRYSDQSQAILVELKNHINDTTSHFALKKSSGASTSAPKGRLGATLSTDNSSSARLVIDNKSDEDLFSWEITCNKEFSLLNLNRVSDKTIRYMAPKDDLATVLAGDQIEVALSFRAAPNSGGKLECTINRDIKVTVE